MMLARFYDLWQRGERQPLSQALRQAQCWLRDTTNREKAEYYRKEIPRPGGTKLPAAVATEFFGQMGVRRRGDRDFDHPFLWAAFHLTGV
jgi:CHAT domain-containing protein